MKREQLGSTGIGRGVAIPHAKHVGADRLIGSLAFRAGVQFREPGRRAGPRLVLLISPQDRPGPHLRALENVSRSLRDDGFVRALSEGARSRDDVETAERAVIREAVPLPVSQP